MAREATLDLTETPPPPQQQYPGKVQLMLHLLLWLIHKYSQMVSLNLLQYHHSRVVQLCSSGNMGRHEFSRGWRSSNATPRQCC